MADPIISYDLRGSRYLNVTSRCTLRCAFCPKFNGSWTVADYDLRLHQEPDAGQFIAAGRGHAASDSSSWWAARRTIAPGAS